MSSPTIMTAGLLNSLMILELSVTWRKNQAKSRLRTFINKSLDLIGRLLLQISYKVSLDTVSSSICFASKTDIITTFSLTLMDISFTLITLSSFHLPLETWAFKKLLLNWLQITWNLWKAQNQTFSNILNFFSFSDLNLFGSTRSKLCKVL